MTTAFSFNLPPREALRFFDAKYLQDTFAWQDMLHAQHDVAFTVAKMLDLDLLSDVQAALRQAMADGQTRQWFIDHLKPTLQEAGWWGRQDMADPATGEVQEVQLGSTRRLKLIYDVNLRTAHAAGQWERILKNVDTAPYLMYLAVDDDRTRPAHHAWSHRIYRWDDTWWETHFPPNGWNCRCWVIQLTELDLKRMGLSPEDIKPAPPVETSPWVNPRTGQTVMVPKGVDPGWGYQPGRTANEELLRTALEKFASAPANLGAAAYSAMAQTLRPQLEKDYAAWLATVLADGVKRGRLQVVGILSPETVAWLARVKGIEPINAEVAVTDAVIVGAKAERHAAAGDALSAAEWGMLPSIIGAPEQLLFDARSGKLLYIYGAADSRAMKIAVEFDYQTKRGKGVFNMIVSAYKTRAENIDSAINGKQYEIVG